MTKREPIPIGPLLGAVGAIMLIVSLCLDWYEDITGFTVFEALDLALVGLALATIVSLAGGLGLRWPSPPASPTRSLVVAIVTVAIVVSQLLNDPPAAAGPGGPDHAVGIWLALGGAGLMVLGALAGAGHLSYALDLKGERSRSEPAAPRTTPEAPTEVEQAKQEED